MDTIPEETILLHQRMLPLAEEAAFKVKNWCVIDDREHGLAYEGTHDDWTIITTRAPRKLRSGDQEWHCEATATKAGLNLVMRFPPPCARVIHTKASAYLLQQRPRTH